MAWQRVSRLEALRHPLYGAGGWLGFWSVMMILGIPALFIRNVGALSTAHPSDFNTLDQLVPWASRANDSLVWGGMLAVLVFAVLWFCRVPSYRTLYVTIVIGMNLLGLAVVFVIGLCANIARPGVLGLFLGAALPPALAPLLLSLPFIRNCPGRQAGQTTRMPAMRLAGSPVKV